VVTAPSIAQPFAGHRRTFLLFLAAYPVLWVLGLAYFMWPLLAIGFVLAVFGRPPVRVSPGFGLWVLFLIWMLASAMELSSHQRYLLFSWRAIIYLTATALFLWVYNAAEDQLPADAVARALTALFAVAVVGGVLGVIDPTASMESLAQHLLPRSWLSNTTAYAYVHPALAQIQFKALGHPIGRPMAPFAYTNQWAATVGVLMPFAVITALRSRPGVRRHALVALLALSVVPIVVSLNRGLWMALGVALVYACVRLATIGYRRQLSVALMAVAAIAVGVAISPLGGLVQSRVGSEHNSNSTRASLYQQSFSGVASSPLLGYGSPQPSTSGGTGEARVGTQGQFYLILVSHGIPGIVFYLGWFVFTFLHAWRRRTVEEVLWSCVLVISFVEMMVYDFLPLTIYVIMIACALLWRRRMRQPRSTGAVATAIPRSLIRAAS
jgi:polysaccharide biosynthesis protein PslJ